MSAMASQLTSITTVYWGVYSGADQRKQHSPASLTFVMGIHRWPVNTPHNGPVTRKMFPFDDVIMIMDIHFGFCRMTHICLTTTAVCQFFVMGCERPTLLMRSWPLKECLIFLLEANITLCLYFRGSSYPLNVSEIVQCGAVITRSFFSKTFTKDTPYLARQGEVWVSLGGLASGWYSAPASAMKCGI